VAIASAVVAVVGVGVVSSEAHRPPLSLHRGFQFEPRGAVVVTIGGRSSSPAIPAGFVGLSIEYFAVEPYAGTNPAAIDPVLVKLIGNLDPGQSPVLRIGGDSTDWTWWPVAHTPKPGGVTFTLDRRWIAVARALSRAVDGRLILGINLEADSAAVAAAEADALVGGIGRARVLALEPGNEPELYGTFAWYTRNGHGVTGRPPGYDFADFTADFSRIARPLPPAALAGPSIGVPARVPALDQFLAAEPRLGLVSLHAYPLLECFTPPSSPRYPTIPRMLAASSSAGPADSVSGYVATARRFGLPLRVDEMNSVGCGSAPGVSDTFASALWLLDASFEMARVGVAGINIHTYPGSTSQLFTLSHRSRRWSAFVEPEYYGLEMFAQAAPPGARLLQTSAGATADVRPWATLAPDGTLRVVLINDAAGRRTIAVRAPGNRARAKVEQLLAPSVRARDGITLGGQSFGRRTATGLLAGRRRLLLVAPAGGDYVVKMPATSAALLTFPAR